MSFLASEISSISLCLTNITNNLASLGPATSRNSSNIFLGVM